MFGVYAGVGLSLLLAWLFNRADRYSKH